MYVTCIDILRSRQCLVDGAVGILADTRACADFWGCEAQAGCERTQEPEEKADHAEAVMQQACEVAAIHKTTGQLILF
ncbi:hypothetical protein SQ11_01760 [Nitrosospira sp. NpAV]|nr:hypothetical protein SQ11_01760 [Nitrosospira sp. NpAV]